MAIQEQYILSKDANGDIRLVQNSVDVFKSTNASALVNTLNLKEGMVGIGLVSPTAKLHVQVANTINKPALLVEQLDTTNNPICSEINNDGTNRALYIHQDGVLAASKYGLYVYSDAVQVYAYLQGLARFQMDNASASMDVVDILNDGTGIGLRIQQLGNGVCQGIENNGTRHGLYIAQAGVLGSGYNSIYIESNAVQINSYLFRLYQVNASSTAGVASIVNIGTGHGLLISQNGVLAASQHGLYLYSNAIQVNSPLAFLWQVNASSTANVLTITNDGTGHVLYMGQNGNLATGKYVLYIDNNGTPIDGVGRCIRLDGCTVSGTGVILGYIGINVDGTQRAIPYYAIV